MKKEIIRLIGESAKTIQSSDSLSNEIENSVKLIVKSLKKGRKIVLFGNGGSATDAQHIAAEFIGRFDFERESIPAIALTADSSVITALSNDYSYDIVFSRQCESLVLKGDIVIGISTSGDSNNVKKGLLISKKKGATTIGLLGNKGGSIKKIVDLAIVVMSSSTPRIQEAHRTIAHIICELVEKCLMKSTNKEKPKKKL